MALLYIEPISRRITKSDLLAWLDGPGRIDRRKVGRIELRVGSAVIEVPDEVISRLVHALNGKRLADRPVRAWTDSGEGSRADDDDHFSRLARLLQMESTAEAQEAADRARRLSPADAERSGKSLIRLAITDEETGLGGRYLVELVKRDRAPLPWTRLRVGSPVVLSAESGKPEDGYRGVVCRRTADRIRVALGHMPDDLGDYDRWRVDLSNDEIAIQRQRIALAHVQAARADRLAELRDVLLGTRAPRFNDDTEPLAFETTLNETQREAVRFALSAEDVALIHGPPGTGKTTTVVELIGQAADRGQKVLACAPSNLAVDNIFEKLLARGCRAVRLGHPARVLAELRDHTLDLLVDEHRDVRLARKLVKEAMALFRKAGRTRRARPQPGQRRETRDEAKSLLADARRLEAEAAQEILDRADVLCATTTGLSDELLGSRRFDLAVIDEACQSTEPGCWIPLLRADRVVLAGDHCQLPPTVISREAAAAGFGVSLFERLMALHGKQIARRLTVQYRMHEAIMDFSSFEFYDGELEADPSVREHLLRDMAEVADTPLVQTPLEFIDTAGAGYEEQLEPDGESRLNPEEAALVCRKVTALLEAGLPPTEIAVIAPYAAQVRHLREALTEPGLEIDSVDGFQGREKEAVLISLVRSNEAGEIGFLGDVRRMNVALTRARRKLLVVGDSATLSVHPFYGRLLEYFESKEAYRTVWEEDGLV